jgi:membrane-associated phospholipid phosphatase
VTPRRRTPRRGGGEGSCVPPRPRSWWPDAALLAGFAALTLALAAGKLLGVDVAVARWADAHRPGGIALVAGWANHLGDPWALPVLALAVALLLRSWRAVLVVGTAFAVVVVPLTALKVSTRRAAPHAALAHPERFGLGGTEYPSGHLVSAIVWYGVLAVLLARWPWVRVARWLPPVVLTFTTVYLGYHWLTDTLAGILLGLLLDRQLRRIPWDLREPALGLDQ